MLLILLTLPGCKKQQKVTSEFIPSELKEYTLFQPGSFWIYKNEITGAIDSSYITKKPEFVYHSEGYDIDTLEICHIYFDGTFISSTQLEPHHYYMYINRYEFEAIRPTSFTPDQIFNFGGGATLKYFPLIDSMTIDNTTFHNVFVTQHQYVSLAGDTFSNTSYFVKKIGLIKFNRKVPNADTTWHILTYHVKQ